MQGNNQSNATRADQAWNSNLTVNEYYDLLSTYIFTQGDLLDLIGAIQDRDEGRYYYGVIGITWFVESGVIEGDHIIQWNWLKPLLRVASTITDREFQNRALECLIMIVEGDENLIPYLADKGLI